MSGNYFTSPKEGIDFIPSGCTLLDMVLGGGWPLGRIANIVGDKSSGKTLIAIEAAANFHAKWPNGKVWYREAEAAFDMDYAEALGMPVDAVDFGVMKDSDGEEEQKVFQTVEDVYEDLKQQCASNNAEGLYIIDSLDALSDRAEMDRDFSADTFGGTKPKKMGELFRRLVQEVSRTNICVMIISQVRDNIGASFGETKVRTGGRALDFYASQVLWLAQKGKINREANKAKRAVGIEVKAQCKKNKVALPFRECAFPIYFGFGIDDVIANLEWLKELGRSEEIFKEIGESNKPSTMLSRAKNGSISAEDYERLANNLPPVVTRIWYEIESEFIPKRRKYA